MDRSRGHLVQPSAVGANSLVPRGPLRRASRYRPKAGARQKRGSESWGRYEQSREQRVVRSVRVLTLARRRPSASVPAQSSNLPVASQNAKSPGCSSPLALPLTSETQPNGLYPQRLRSKYGGSALTWRSTTALSPRRSHQITLVTSSGMSPRAAASGVSWPSIEHAPNPPSPFRKQRVSFSGPCPYGES